MKIVTHSARQGSCNQLARLSAFILLCVSLSTTLLTTNASPLNPRTYETGKEPWLADGSFYDIDYIGDVPQADGHPIALDMCPPVPKVLPAGGCDLEECRSDRECVSQGLMCCYNGCSYTCLPHVRPAAVIDWLREPRRRLQFGSSWLVSGRDQERDVIMCSTTPPDDDSDQLMCPHGFQCVIDDQGAPSKGVPNSGHCVQTVDNSSDEKFKFESQTLQAATDKQKDAEEPRHHCKISESSILLSGHSITVNGKNCLCYETKLMCED